MLLRTRSDATVSLVLRLARANMATCLMSILANNSATETMKRKWQGLLARVDPLLGRPKKKQIIICGYPRGGTSLLYNMMSSNLPGFVCDTFEVPALKSLWRYQNHLSKNPMDILQLEEISARNVRNKRIFVIIVIRDPRDVLTSRHPNGPDRYFIDYDGRWSPRGVYPYDIVYTDMGVKRVHRAILGSTQIRGINAVQVRYEDLVMNPDEVQGRIGEFIEVSFCGLFSEFHKKRKKHAYKYEGDTRPKDSSLVRENQAVDTSRLGKWRMSEHAPRIAEQFTAHKELFDIVRAYGYEADDLWFDAYRAKTD